MDVFVVSTRTEGLRFRVLEFNPDTKMGVVVGPIGTAFPLSLTKANMEKHGYKLVKENDDAE